MMYSPQKAQSDHSGVIALLPQSHNDKEITYYYITAVLPVVSCNILG